MVETKKGDALDSTTREKGSESDDVGKDFLTSWKSISAAEDVGLYLNQELIPMGQKNMFNFDKLDMDFSLDGDFGKKISSFEVDMSDLDFNSLTKNPLKTREGRTVLAETEKKGGKQSRFHLTSDFNELDSFDFGSSFMKGENKSDKTENTKGLDSPRKEKVQTTKSKSVTSFDLPDDSDTDRASLSQHASTTESDHLVAGLSESYATITPLSTSANCGNVTSSHGTATSLQKERTFVGKETAQCRQQSNQTTSKEPTTQNAIQESYIQSMSMEGSVQETLITQGKVCSSATEESINPEEPPNNNAKVCNPESSPARRIPGPKSTDCNKMSANRSSAPARRQGQSLINARAGNKTADSLTPQESASMEGGAIMQTDGKKGQNHEISTRCSLQQPITRPELVYKCHKGDRNVGSRTNFWVNIGACTSINALNNDLLMEVFRRLPSVKAVFRSCLVCKNWSTLIAAHFVPDFFGLFYNTCPSGVRRRDRWEFVCLADSVSEGVKSSVIESCLNSASVFPPHQYLDFNDGLILAFQPDTLQYFLSNPFTQQWVHVPYSHRDILLDSGAVTYGSQYKVLNLGRSSSISLLNIYSSMSQHWQSYHQEFEYLVDGAVWSVRSFVLDNKVYRLSCSGHLLTFDLDNVSSSSIELPEIENAEQGDASNGCLGVSQGVLLYSRRFCSPSSINPVSELGVWTFVHTSKTWFLIHSVPLQFFSEHPACASLRDHSPFSVFAFHPTADVLYVGNCCSIFSYNLGSQSLQNIVSIADSRRIHSGPSLVFPFTLNQNPFYGQTISHEQVVVESERLDLNAEIHRGFSLRPDVYDNVGGYLESIYPQKLQQQANLSEVLFKEYDLLCRHQLPSRRGIFSVDSHPFKDEVAAAGFGLNAVVLDKSTGEVLSSITGHTKKVNCIRYALADDELIVTGSADMTVRVWDVNEDHQYVDRHVFSDHLAEVTAVEVHGSSDYLVTTSLDHTWCFYDLLSGERLCQVGLVDVLEEGYTCASLHPCGDVLGIGTLRSLVKIWHIRTGAMLALYRGHDGPIKSISFSHTFMATAASDGVRVWDQRSYLQTMTLVKAIVPSSATSVMFDSTGRFLATTDDTCVRIFRTSDWECIQSFTCSAGPTVVHFSSDNKYVAVGLMNGGIDFYEFSLRNRALQNCCR